MKNAPSVVAKLTLLDPVNFHVLKTCVALQKFHRPSDLIEAGIGFFALQVSAFPPHTRPA